MKILFTAPVYTIIRAIITTVLLLFCNLTMQAQEEGDDKPRFRMTDAVSDPQCSDYGTKFERGYVTSPKNKWVNVMIYFQKKDGSFVNRFFSREGTGFINLNLADCNFTGNYYAYLCYAADQTCKFPTKDQVQAKHKEIQTTKQPQCKITRVLPYKCEGVTGANFESAFVYSPTGGEVEITLFLERKNGDWRKKHYTFYGTGLLMLNIKDCELSGKYKVNIGYIKHE
jgi:hypothetical protein